MRKSEVVIIMANARGHHSFSRVAQTPMIEDDEPTPDDEDVTLPPAQSDPNEDATLPASGTANTEPPDPPFVPHPEYLEPDFSVIRVPEFSGGRNARLPSDRDRFAWQAGCLPHSLFAHDIPGINVTDAFERNRSRVIVGERKIVLNHIPCRP